MNRMSQNGMYSSKAVEVIKDRSAQKQNNNFQLLFQTQYVYSIMAFLRKQIFSCLYNGNRVWQQKNTENIVNGYGFGSNSLETQEIFNWIENVLKHKCFMAACM